MENHSNPNSAKLKHQKYLNRLGHPTLQRELPLQIQVDSPACP